MGRRSILFALFVQQEVMRIAVIHRVLYVLQDMLLEKAVHRVPSVQKGTIHLLDLHSVPNVDQVISLNLMAKVVAIHAH